MLIGGFLLRLALLYRPAMPTGDYCCPTRRGPSRNSRLLCGPISTYFPAIEPHSSDWRCHDGLSCTGYQIVRIVIVISCCVLIFCHSLSLVVQPLRHQLLDLATIIVLAFCAAHHPSPFFCLQAGVLSHVVQCACANFKCNNLACIYVS